MLRWPRSARLAADAAALLVASFIARTLGNLLEADVCITEPDYFDDDAGNPHETCINGLADIGIVAGVSAGAYAPNADVNRGQMAAFLMRPMDLLVEQELASRPATS
jgi:hypothetical protein